MTQQPETLTLETMKAAACDFAMLVNSGALPLPVRFGGPGRNLREAFIRFCSARFNFSLSPDLLDSDAHMPHVNVRAVVALGEFEWFYIEYQSVDQRIFGLDSDLLVFAARLTQQSSLRDPLDEPALPSIAIQRVLYVRQERTTDRQVTERINAILDEQPAGESGRDELMGYIASLSPHLLRAERGLLADRILAQRPQVGALRFRNPHWQIRALIRDSGVEVLHTMHAVEHMASEQSLHDQPEK